MSKSQTSLLFLFGSQSQEQHQCINTDILTPMSVPLKTHPNSKLKDVVNQSMKHFLLHAPSLSPEKFLNQRTPMCWTRGRFSAGMRCSFRCHLKKSKKCKVPLTAPSMILKMSHRKPQMTMVEGGVYRGRRERVQSGQRNIPRNPVSRSCDSHPVVPTCEK